MDKHNELFAGIKNPKAQELILDPNFRLKIIGYPVDVSDFWAAYHSKYITVDWEKFITPHNLLKIAIIQNNLEYVKIAVYHGACITEKILNLVPSVDILNYLYDNGLCSKSQKMEIVVSKNFTSQLVDIDTQTVRLIVKHENHQMLELLKTMNKFTIYEILEYACELDKVGICRHVYATYPDEFVPPLFAISIKFLSHTVFSYLKSKIIYDMKLLIPLCIKHKNFSVFRYLSPLIDTSDVDKLIDLSLQYANKYTVKFLVTKFELDVNVIYEKAVKYKHLDIQLDLLVMGAKARELPVMSIPSVWLA